MRKKTIRIAQRRLLNGIQLHGTEVYTNDECIVHAKWNLEKIICWLVYHKHHAIQVFYVSWFLFCYAFCYCARAYVNGIKGFEHN